MYLMSALLLLRLFFSTTCSLTIRGRLVMWINKATDAKIYVYYAKIHVYYVLYLYAAIHMHDHQTTSPLAGPMSYVARHPISLSGTMLLCFIKVP